MTIRLIKPWAHTLFVDHDSSPRYMHCTGDTCVVCRKVAAGKNLQALDEIVKRQFGQA